MSKSTEQACASRWSDAAASTFSCLWGPTPSQLNKRVFQCFQKAALLFAQSWDRSVPSLIRNKRPPLRCYLLFGYSSAIKALLWQSWILLSLFHVPVYSPALVLERWLLYSISKLREETNVRVLMFLWEMTWCWFHFTGIKWKVVFKVKIHSFYHTLVMLIKTWTLQMHFSHSDCIFFQTEIYDIPCKKKQLAGCFWTGNSFNLTFHFHSVHSCGLLNPPVSPCFLSFCFID